MKKLLLILLLGISVLTFNNKTYSYESYENKVCKSIELGEGYFKYCLDNYYIVDNTNNRDYTIYNNKEKIIFKVSYYEKNISGKINIKNYEGKYGNHIYSTIIPYTLADAEFCGLNCEFDEKEEIIKHDKIIKENRDELGIYIDGKKVFDYALSTEKYRYKGLGDFANRNGIVAYDHDREHIWGHDKEYIGEKDEIYLSERTRVKLDKFVQKVEKIKYPKEKLLKKLEVLYKKYEGKKGYKSKFYKEVITYLYIEVLINKLKQSDKLEKINFYD